MKEVREKSVRYEESDAAKEKGTSRPIHDNGIGHFHERLQKALGDESVRGFSRRSGVSETALRAYLAGKSEPSRPALIAMADAAGVSVEWLAVGDRKPTAAPEARIGDEFALVPLYDLEVSAGGGAITDRENIVSQIAFRRDWLRHVGLNINHLVSVSVRGDSMEPSIRDGDMLLVDTSQTDVVEDGIYVLRIDSHLLAKRLQRLVDGRLYIKSDNPAYERQELSKQDADQLEVIGRVVWSGRKI